MAVGELTLTGLAARGSPNAIQARREPRLCKKPESRAPDPGPRIPSLVTLRSDTTLTPRIAHHSPFAAFPVCVILMNLVDTGPKVITVVGV
jgi:hypothetical protein